MSLNLCITSADGQTGHLIAELLLTDTDLSSKIAKLTCLSLHPDKVKLAKEMIMATRQAEIKNAILLSSAGCDLAERETQPRLCEFIDIEALFMETKSLPATQAAISPCIIRAGFYAENILLYNKDVRRNGKLRLPIGDTHSFAPVALGDIAQIAAHIMTSEGPMGLSDKVRGQLIVMTGPRLVNGTETAQLATEVGLNMEFEDKAPGEAKQLLDADTDVDDSEKEYLLEYYSLVREGKTNYVSTIAFNALTGGHPTELPDLLKLYDAEFKPKRRRIR